MRAKEFIIETPEDDHELISVTRELASRLYARTKSYQTYIGDWELSLTGVTTKDISAKIGNDTLIGKLANSIQYLIFTDDDTVSGRFFPDPMKISVNTLVFKGKPKSQAISLIQQVIIHELRHAYDYVKSNKEAFKSDLKTDEVTNNMAAQFDAYLKQPSEISARYTEAILLITQLIPSTDIKTAINKAFAQALITPQITGRKKYQHLVSRAYRFFTHQQENPAAKTKSWVQKAINFIFGNA